MRRYVVAGIGTGVGKTVASAVLAKALGATYWKPVQAGDLEQSDTLTVQHLAGPDCPVLPERFRLKTPASPHWSAELDGVRIAEEDLSLPEGGGGLVVETAGGLMVPLNDEGLLYIDVMQRWGLPVMLVTRHYLGSINHTLLSLYTLKQRGVRIAGLIVSGDEHAPSELVYREHFPGLPHFRIPELTHPDSETIAKIAGQWKELPG